MFTNIKSKKFLQKGFTLIELLIVVAIIAILTSVVLFAISDARLRGQNQKKNTTILQYITAAEMFRTKYGVWPGSDYPEVLAGNQFCLAEGPCYNGISTNTSLNNDFKEFIAGMPSDTFATLDSSGTDLKGYRYTCINPTGSSFCPKYRLDWVLSGDKNDCGPGNVDSVLQNGVRLCAYISQ